MAKKAMVLLSGGIDSATTLFWAKSRGYDLHVLSIDYYNRPKKEIESTSKLCKIVGAECTRVHMPFIMEIDDLRKFDYPLSCLQNAPAGYIPMKNILFYSVAGYFCELHGIHTIIGGQILTDEDLYPDASRNYFKSIESLINKGAVSHIDEDLKIIFPLQDMDKSNVIKKGIQFNVPFQYTWSCYEDFQIPCGVCKGCLERKSGFEKLKIEDPLIQDLLIEDSIAEDSVN